MVSQVYTYVRTYQIVNFKHKQFIVYQLYLNKAVFRKWKTNILFNGERLIW